MQYLVIKSVVNLYLPVNPYLPLLHIHSLNPKKHQHQIPHPLTSIPKTPQYPTSYLHKCCKTIFILNK